MAAYREGNLVIVHPEKKLTDQQIDLLSKLLAIELRVLEPELKMITTYAFLFLTVFFLLSSPNLQHC